MKDGSFYVIQSFMITDLRLKPNEAVVYAIIYGFSQDGESVFKGSLNYLVDCTNLSRQTVINVLKELTSRNLIIKKEVYNNNVKSCEYLANLETLKSLEDVSVIGDMGSTNSVLPVQNLDEGSQNFRPTPVQNLDGGSQNFIPTPVQNLDGGSQNFRPNNIIYNIDNNIEDSIESSSLEATPPATPPQPKTKSKAKETRHKFGEYNHVLLTNIQYTALVEKFGKDVIDSYIKQIDEWIQLKGKSPYKDFNLAIQKWLTKDNVQPNPKQCEAYDCYQSESNGWWGD